MARVKADNFGTGIRTHQEYEKVINKLDKLETLFITTAIMINTGVFAILYVVGAFN